MKTPTSRTQLLYGCALALSVMLSSAAQAQQVAPEPSPAAPVPPEEAKKVEVTKQTLAESQKETGSANKDSDVIELNPFVIEAESETGYVASSSLAGSRLNTSLKDIANQIQVMTPEFLADMGAFDADDAFRYSINTENGAEVAGTGGNYFGGGGATGNSATNRTRGLEGATNTRNFFASNFPKDRYNSGQQGITIAGGPNAILFGLGSAAGIAESQDDTVNLRKLSNRVTLSTDTNGSMRWELSNNTPIIKGKVGLRLALLNSNKDFWLKPSHEEDKRIYAKLSWKIAKDWETSTGVEFMDRNANRAVTILPKDSVSAWTNPGDTNSTPYSSMIAAPAGNIYNWGSGDLSPTYTYGANISNPGLYFNRYTASVKSVGSYLVDNKTGIPGFSTYSQDTTFQNKNIYPFSSYSPYGNTHPADLKGKRFTQMLSGRVLPDLFLEAGVNYEYTENRAANIYKNVDASIYVDPNLYAYNQLYAAKQPTATGSVTAAQATANQLQNAANRSLNPGLGSLYLEGQQVGSKGDTLYREARTSLVYKFNAEKHIKSAWAKWIGIHSLSTNVGYSDRIFRNQGGFQRLIKDIGVDPVTGLGIAPGVIYQAAAIDLPYL